MGRYDNQRKRRKLKRASSRGVKPRKPRKRRVVEVVVPNETVLSSLSTLRREVRMLTSDVTRLAAEASRLRAKVEPPTWDGPSGDEEEPTAQEASPILGDLESGDF